MEDREVFTSRVESIIENLVGHTPGADVHPVSNMSHRANMLLDILKGAEELPIWLESMVKRLETDQYEYFKKKFS